MRRASSISLLTLCILASKAAAGGGAYEWAGIFAVPDKKYMWTAQKKLQAKKNTIDYADDNMNIVVMPTNDATEATLKAKEKEGKEALEKTCTDVQSTGSIVPAANSCYKLIFDKNVWQSLYTLDTSDVSFVAIYTQHVPTEFENTAHYLKDKAGEDIEPGAEIKEEAPAKKAPEKKKADWGNSMGAAIIVSFVTLSGLILVVPAFIPLAKQYTKEFEAALLAFAAGALLACAFFLLLFEATHLIGVGWKKEVEVLWRWGTMILAGYLLPALIEGPVSMALQAKTDKSGDEKEKWSAQIRVIAAVTIGDFLHNLCDGFFIGAAFKGCGTKFGWNVSMATILHEIPQELADYAILTGGSCGFSPVKAILLNFTAGLSVILGVIIVNVSEMDDKDTGLLLAFGGGTYVYLACSESLARVYELKVSVRMRILCLALFFLGTVVIGLILLDHQHCIPEVEGESGGDAHAGHNH